MPLLSPSQIHSVLRPQIKKEEKSKTALLDLLENANLTPAEILENLSSLMRAGETDGVKLKAAETALKLNGLLDDRQAAPDFQVTINIIDGEFKDLNPILIPRET